MSMLSEQVRDELFDKECCRVRAAALYGDVPPPAGKGSKKHSSASPVSKGKGGIVLDLNIGNWSDRITDQLLADVTAQHKAIALTLKHVPYISPQLVDLLVKYVGPKLLEITIIDCLDITWTDHVRKILEPATFLEMVNFTNGTWVDDGVVEQLSKKFDKTLKAVNFENTKITDSSLFHIGKRCLLVRHLSINCCPRVTDTGFFEVAKKIHLSRLQIAHNIHVTDESLEAVLSNTHDLVSLNLNNCPKLTDRTIGALYEKIVSWGKRRNLKAQTLEEIDVKENPNFTSEILTFLSTAAPRLNRLDIRECPRIELMSGMREIESMKALEHLYIGPPGAQTIDAEQLLESLLFHVANLKTLHLAGFSTMIDEQIAELMTNALVLTDLALVDMHFGQLFTESLCSNVPNVTRLTLAGSKIFEDAELRCMSSILLFLRELTVQRCPLLTDNGFARCNGLKRLKKLDLSYVSKLARGTFMANFTTSPLETLIVDGFEGGVSRDFSGLSPLTKNSVETLCLRNTLGLTEADVTFLLANFPKCTLLDISGSYHLTSRLQSLYNPHPFLAPVNDGDFLGFRLQQHNHQQHHQIWTILEQIQMHRAAKKLQRLRRKYLKKLQDAIEERRRQRMERDLYLITLVQKVFRMQSTRRRILRKLRAGRHIVVVARACLNHRQYLHIVAAKEWRRLRMLRQLWPYLRQHWLESHAGMYILAAKAKKVVEMRYKREYYKKMIESEKISRDARFEDAVIILWENRIIPKIFNSWKKLLTGPRNHKYLRMQWVIFQNVVDLNCYNSSRQRALVLRADNFRMRRRLAPVWLALGDDFMRARVAELKMPRAAAHFEKSFYFRVVGFSFRAIRFYWQSKLIKRRSLAAADQFLPRHRKAVGVEMFNFVANKRIYGRKGIKAAVQLNTSRWYFLALARRLPINTLFVKHFKQSEIDAYVLWRDTIVKAGFKYLMVGSIRVKHMRELLFVANRARRIKYEKLCYTAWKKFACENANLGNYYYRLYLLQWCKKCLLSFKKVIVERKGYMDKLRVEMEARTGKANALVDAMVRIVQFQARVRGGILRAKHNDYKMQLLYSTLILQKFFRRIIAKFTLIDLRRKFVMKERVAMFKEIELMIEADKEAKYYDFHFKNAIEIQRVFRGFDGRKKGAVLAMEIVKSRNTAFYESMVRIREGIAARRRANELREKKRSEAAVSIQKIARGRKARKDFVMVKKQAKLVHFVKWVQTFYRGKLSKMKLEALRRKEVADIRFRAARRQRGGVLRMWGFPKRRQQKQIALPLEALGMDPLSFNYRVDELLRDTYHDFITVYRIIQRELTILKTTGFDRIDNVKMRRKIINEQGWGMQLHDSVKIIQSGNPFCGQTGVIVRIDVSIPGTPLYEIKLDGMGDRQTFLKMTLDALATYTLPQPLAKTERRPVLGEVHQPFVIYGLSTDNPLFQRKNVTAAWIIQRAFRIYRSKRIVARRRYEMWMRTADHQAILFNYLAESNTLTTQAHNTLQVLGLRPQKSIFYDEIRHPAVPPRLISSSTKVNEKVSIKNELEQKISERLKYLEKCAVIRGKEYFDVGYERFTRYRKLALLWRRFVGKRMKPGSKIADVDRGVKGVKGSQALVTGMDQYVFPQFLGSPHIRYSKKMLYQGEWSGVPMFTPLHPHGEGLCMFLDGWGFAKEDKVLYLTINHCRYLNAMDLSTSDPFCVVTCNGTILSTTVKWKNLNPDFYESFEIDVTNPAAVCNISVFDRDYIGSDDFMGQIQLKLDKYVDGSEVTETHLLKGENLDENEDFDRGEITIKVRWTARKFEDDMVREEKQKKKIVRLQAWARRMSAEALRKRLALELAELHQLTRTKATVIVNACRIRLARRELRKMLRRNRMALKIQKRVRIMQARKVTKRKRLRRNCAVEIQRIARGFIARARRRRMVQGEKNRLGDSATVIQKYGRRLIALQWLAEERKKVVVEEEEEGDFEVEVVKERVKDWIKVFGCDPDPVYGLKRNRRITERIFQAILKTKYVRVLTKFGILYVDSRPVYDDTSIDKDSFLTTFLPSFKPGMVHREEAMTHFEARPHYLTVHIPSSVYMRESVFYNVTIVQCRVRQRIALKEKAKILKLHRAIGKFQLIFRRRNERQQHAAVCVISLFRLIYSKKVTQKRRLEKKCAIILQCAYRSHTARRKEIDLRSVRRITVLKCSSQVPLHGPEMALAHRMQSFWLAESTDYAEVRVELEKVECITDIWIQTSMFECSPRTVTVSTVKDKGAKKYETLIRSELPNTRGDRWHIFHITPTISKYFKVNFGRNYGDPAYIGVRQIRFLRSKEISAKVVRQPTYYMPDGGPSIGDVKRLTLRVDAIGWPPPTYQWYRHSTPIPCATAPTLDLVLHCPIASSMRIYRCIKCKMVAYNCPVNAYHVSCSNCNFKFAYKEIEEYDTVVAGILRDEGGWLDKERKLRESEEQMLAALKDDVKLLPLLKDVQTRLKEAIEQIQMIREARYSAKVDLKFTNKYSDEGIYTCYVSNVRGKDLVMLTKSSRCVVAVVHGVPYFIRVRPEYIPRVQGMRKKWTTYSSVLGTFKKGRLEGLCTINYADGSFYEGPYIGEEFLNVKGKVLLPYARSGSHYGVFRCPDGRVFEGSGVDNHFDPNNLQAFYRMTTRSGEVYEGLFCDEHFHGVGMYTYKDGSVYEGLWYCGTRFGHGHFRSAEGWAYEGFFDTNRRHLEGVITWADGSMYMGQWYYDKIQGNGIIISKLRDVYRGSLKDGLYDGYGQLIYSNGSIHCGMFKEGQRHGRGIFSVIDGCEYYGQYVNDELHGEVIIKQNIAVEERGQDNYDIRIGIYDDGTFIKYKSKAANPVATKQFIALFQENRAMFDSIYSMILAKNLPNLPAGVDINSEDVRDIVFRLRTEAGQLMGENALRDAQQRIDDILKPLNKRKTELTQLQDDIDALGFANINLDRDMEQLRKKFEFQFAQVDKTALKIEQYWHDEPTMSKARFQIACANLSKVTKDEYFQFRNHREPPPFTKKILDAISYAMGWSLDWKKQVLLIADSVFCGRNGEEDALRFDYDCKLAHMMKTFRVYDHVKIINDAAAAEGIRNLLADPRFKKDSYYVESCGVAGPYLVDWFKHAYIHINASVPLLGTIAANDEKRLDAFRLKAIFTKKGEEIKANSQKKEILQRKLKTTREEFDDLNLSLLQANDTLQFISANAMVKSNDTHEDYYLVFERNLEAQRDKFDVDATMEVLLSGVEGRFDQVRRAKIQACRAKGVEFVEPVVPQPQITDWLRAEIIAKQKMLVEEQGRSLGYEFELSPTALTYEEACKYVDICVDLTIGNMNEVFNDFAHMREWRVSKPSGKLVTARFLYIIAWQMWEHEAVAAEDAKAVAAWEEIFKTPEECSRSALEAKVNERMSAAAREQGRVWAKLHPLETAMMEAQLAGAFAATYPSTEENELKTARKALEIHEGLSKEENPPPLKAQAMCWVRLNPSLMSAAKDEYNLTLADQFKKQFSNTAEAAFNILNGLCDKEEDYNFTDLADHWRSFNTDEYKAAADAKISGMAAEFAAAEPENTHTKAAEVLFNDSLAKYTTDAEVLKEIVGERKPKDVFNAQCYRTRNQGMVGKATTQLVAAAASKAKRHWLDLAEVTQTFTKGSYLLTSDEAKNDPSLDRFLGFRERLQSMHAWFYSYLCKTQDDLYKALEELELKDPFGKVAHRMRPSQAEKILRKQERDFAEGKRRIEGELGDIYAKLSAWNTYFGTTLSQEGAEAAI